MKTSSKLLAGLMMLAGFTAWGETNNLAGTDGYQVIGERNCFSLKSSMPVESSLQSAAAPNEDLFLTGLTECASHRCAFFKLAEPGGRFSGFVLWEGEQNAWLEIRAIDYVNKTVWAILKKPVIRARGVGTEIVFSFQSHGLTQPTKTTSTDQSFAVADSRSSSAVATDKTGQEEGSPNVFAPHSFPHESQ